MISIKKKILFLQDVYELLNKKFLAKFIYILFILTVASLLEIVGISLIPVFVGMLIDPNLIFEKLSSIFKFVDFQQLADLDKKYLALYFSVLIVAFYFIKNIFLIFVVYLQGNFFKDISITLSDKVFSNYLSADYSFFLSRNSSITIRSITSDVGNTSLYILNTINLVRESLVLIAVISLLLVINIEIALGLALFFSTFVYLFYSFTQKQLYKRAQISQKLNSSLFKTINETLGSIKEIILSNAGDSQLKEFNTNVEQNAKMDIKNYLISSLPRFFLEVVIVTCMVFIVLIFILSGRELIELVPYLTLVTIAALRLLPAFNSISMAISTFKKTLPSVRHIIKENKFFKMARQNKNKKKIIFDKNITIKNVSYSYPGTPKKVLDNFSIEIKKGDKIGIIGESGKGKTTLLNIILGLIRPTKGKIFLDNKDIDFKKYFWGDSVGYVPQEIFLLDNTIKKNITFGIDGGKVDKVLMNKVCKTAQIYKFVQNLPKKFNTIVGENGHNLSVGQKQRLGIARVLYKKPKLIILDEATSSLDYENEQKFIDHVFNIDPNITIIFVSHKISALKNCKRIYDLNKLKFIK